jgi:hypothetical protein
VLGTLHHERHEAREHQDSKGDNMPPRQRSRQSFITLCEAAKARGPAETPLDHLAPWQPHEAFLRLRPFDHFELHPSVAGIGLIHRADSHRGVRDVLLLLGQQRHLRAILFVCGGDMQGQQVAQGIDGHMPFAPRWLLAPLEPAREPLSGLDCRLQLRPEDRAKDARAPLLRGLKKDSSG